MNDKSQPSGNLLRAVDVAKRLNICKSHAYALISRGEIQSVTIGTARRVRPEDLEAFILQNLSPLPDHFGQL
ncbi:MAG: DNA-binding protein [Anaerolineae bacterium]|nr:MAG: DNA-binding protein [Anaerolineae bacterium]